MEKLTTIMNLCFKNEEELHNLWAQVV